MGLDRIYLHRLEESRLVSHMAATKESTEKKSGGKLVHPPVIVDLGQKTRRKVNQLKKGEGPLHDAVCETIEVMQADSVVGKDVQVVMVVVEKMPDGMVFPRMSWN